MRENVQPLGISGHESILDAVVDHLHEVSATGRTAVQISIFRRALAGRAAGRRIGIALSRSERPEYGIEALHRCPGTTNHQAVSTLQSPDASAGSHVNVVD